MSGFAGHDRRNGADARVVTLDHYDSVSSDHNVTPSGFFRNTPPPMF